MRIKLKARFADVKCLIILPGSVQDEGMYAIACRVQRLYFDGLFSIADSFFMIPLYPRQIIVTIAEMHLSRPGIQLNGSKEILLCLRPVPFIAGMVISQCTIRLTKGAI